MATTDTTPATVKLKPAHRHVLKYLAEREEGTWAAHSTLPGGRGFNTRGRSARGEVLREMRQSGWIEYGKEPSHSLYGYRITDAGRAMHAQQGA